MTGLKLSHSIACKNEEWFYSFFCIAIASTLVFWPLLNSIFGLFFLVYWMLFAHKTISFPPNRKYWMILFCLLYLMGIIGLFRSDNIQTAFSKLQHKSALILFPIILGTTSLNLTTVYKRTVIAFAGTVMLACLFCFFGGLYQYFTINSIESLYGYNLVTPLKDMTPFIMAICCLLSFIFLCEEILKLVGTRKSLKINKLFAIYIAGISLLFSFLLLLGNRNVLIITSFVLVYYVFRLLKKLWVRAIVAASILLALTIAINMNPFLKRQWKELTNFSETNKIPLDQDSSLGKSWGGWQLREAIWKCTWDIIKQHPVLGVGTGDAQDSLQAAYERRKFYFASRYNRYNTHNQYLQETVTHGFLGLSVFLFSLIMPFFAKIATEDKRVYYLFIFCFAFICLTDTPLELNKGIVWYSFFNALIFFKSYNFKHKSINGK